MKRVAIIGCGDAGLSAAYAAAKEGADVTVISSEKDHYPRCPLPYYIGGKIKREDLVKPLEQMFRGTGIKLVFDRAVRVEGNTVICEKSRVAFDRAVIATGAIPKRIGDSLVLRTMGDADRMKALARKHKPVIIGGGMLGCELADVLGGTLIEAQKQILPNFDPEFAEAIAAELAKKVEIRAGTTKAPKSDFTISTVGVVPDTELARKSGIKTSEFGIMVDNRLETNMPNVYAAGDCMEEKCFFTKEPMNSYLGPQSEREGVVAGTNASGGDMHYEGSLNAVVAKICGYEIGVTGLCSVAAGKSGMTTTFGRIKAKTKPEFEKTAKDITIKLIFEGEKLVGCQAMGGESVEGVINLATYAMRHGGTVDDLINMSYCYAPPICSAPNPMVLCAENAKRRMRR